MFPTKSLLALSVGLASIPSFYAITSNTLTAPSPSTHRSVDAPTLTAPLPTFRHMYEVSVTNLTRGQIMSPPVVATHSRALKPLWTLGSPASDELAAVAEDAINPPLIAALTRSSTVRSVMVIKGKNGPILPGETAKVVIGGDPWHFNRISLVSMLVITNDAFMGINGGHLPRYGTSTWMSPAYDSGTEENNEKCANIPGPPCGNPLRRATANAEGYVHIHAGIHGIGDLSAAIFDWRNGVAQIRVRRVR